MMPRHRRLSRHFRLGDLLHSDTARGDEPLWRQQCHPPPAVITNLAYLTSTVLQPLREVLDYPLQVSSGYRCPALNTRIGGAATSQHVLGQAADCVLDEDFLTSPRSRRVRRHVASHVLRRTGRPLRADVNANFYLFAFLALHRRGFDLHQLIHEFGDGPGRPGWVHVAVKPDGRPRRELLVLGPYVEGGRQVLSLPQTLRLGT